MKHLVGIAALFLFACSPAGPTQAEGPKPDLDKPPKGASSGEPIAPELGDAQAALEAKNCSVAVEKAKAVLAKNPKHGDAHFILGVCADSGFVDLKADKNDEEAATHYKAALEANPKNTGAAENLSAILVSQKKWDDAISVCKAGLEAIKSASPGLHANLGYALAGKGDNAGAVKSWGNALKLSPDLVDVRLDRAAALAALGQKDEAIKDYKAAGTNAKADSTQKRLAAHSLSGLGEHAACVAVLDGVIVAKPEPDTLTQRAQCKHKAGDLAGASADLAESIKLKPTLNAHGFGAQWAEQAKDKKACTHHWTELGKLGAGKAKAEEESKKGLERCKKL